MRWATAIFVASFSCLPSSPVFAQALGRATLADISLQDWAPFGLICLDVDQILRETSDALLKGQLSTGELRTTLRIRAQALLQKGNMTGAIEAFKELCRRSPEDPDAWAALSLSCYNARFSDKTLSGHALEYAKRAVSVTSPTAWAHCVYAQALMGYSRYAEALGALSNALKVNPKCALAFYLRGLIAYQNRDMRSLLENMDRFLELEPVAVTFDPQLPFFYRGTALCLVGRPKQALRSFLMGRTLRPDCAKCLWGTWRAHADLGKWHLATRIAEEYCRRSSRDSHSLLCLAESYVEIGEKEKAFALVGEVIKSDFSETPHTVLTRIGEIRRKAGDYAEAMRCFDHAIRSYPSAYQPQLAKAFLLSCCPDQRLRDGRGALEMARSVSSKGKVPDWRRWEVDMCLASAYAELGNFKEAIIAGKRALDETDPEAGHRPEYEQRLALMRRGTPYRYGGTFQASGRGDD